METIEHIELSSTNFESTRLAPVLGYLAARLSPYDLKLINSLNDHKGTLEVSVNKEEFDRAVSFAGEAYKDHLLKILKEAWEIENEYLVELIAD
ncbi:MULTISPECIES: hypothetical protein [Sphingobacterium]|uniref:hypothetical protein n=1 Tax=Sphingobacterium TaxID=28453 RepID=UPI00257BB1AB|nr:MULTISPECIES: hypothetical protein [Sphingobacterium]